MYFKFLYDVWPRLLTAFSDTAMPWSRVVQTMDVVDEFFLEVGALRLRNVHAGGLTLSWFQR